MAPINDFEVAFLRNCHCDRCGDISCGFNKLFVEFQAITAGFAVPAGFCENINSLIDDDEVDIVLRAGVYQALLDEDIPTMPTEASETAKCEWIDKAKPVCMDDRAINRAKWPPYIRDKLSY
jgi:hypothetical protein